ncbi:MAG: hypothetical protein DMG68_04095 [Acidobacteria bacterium]|nr:MAG: hypothetical protein DMG68_04095 [Acidobacteriota bacterium]
MLFIYGAERRWLMLKIKWATAPSRSPLTPTGTSFPEQTLHGGDRLDRKTTQQQSATLAQPVAESERMIPAEVVDLCGGPGRIRTYNQQIMSLLL